MVGNKTLLAADVPRHRDVSPDGRGCLWFDSADPRDLGHRISFLTLNPEFRSALGAAGHAFILETRSLASIGARYDAVYRHALSRRKTMSTGAGHGDLSGVAKLYVIIELCKTLPALAQKTSILHL